MCVSCQSRPQAQRKLGLKMPKHRVGICARKRECEPPSQPPKEARAISTDEVPHDPPVKMSDADAKDSAQDEEERMHEDYQCFL